MQRGMHEESPQLQESSQQQKRHSLAIASDPAYAFDLGEKFAPDVDLILSTRIACFGSTGAGKSNMCGRLHEQYHRFNFPFVLFDGNGEHRHLASLGDVVIATANDMPTGTMILSQGLRVVVDLSTWNNLDAAALAMCQCLHELVEYASVQDEPATRWPCPVTLDGAQNWLTRTGYGDLSKDAAHKLRAAWFLMTSRGRSLGLVPSVFTQSISALVKSAMPQPGIYIFMHQASDDDLAQCLEYLYSDDLERMETQLRTLEPGQAIIVLPNGEQIYSTFYPGETSN